MGSDIRARAIATLKAAMARRSVDPRQVVTAISTGDMGIASLMRANRAPIGIPVLHPDTVPPLPESQPASAKAIKALVPWVRMLAKVGHLSDTALSALAERQQKTSTVYLTIATAWEAFKRDALQQADLPKTLPTGMACVFDVCPAPLLDVGATRFAESSFYEPREPAEGISLALQTLEMTHIGFRVRGEDYRAVAGAIDALVKDMALPLIAMPSEICGDVYYLIEELVHDLETIAIWDDAGEVTLPIGEVNVFLEGFGYDEPDEVFVDSLRAHIKWRKWHRENPEYSPQSEAARVWRDNCTNKQFIALFDLAKKCGEFLKSLPKCKRMHPVSQGHMGVECISLIPNGIGIDDWIEDAVNSGYNAGDMVPDLSMVIEANPAQLGQYASRAVIEVAIANLIAAHIELLD